MRVNVQHIAQMLAPVLLEPCKNLQGQEEVQVESVCRDTAEVSAGALFVCIKGARVDGHDFAAKAVEAGAVALLVSHYVPEVSVPQFLVQDTVAGLGALAHAWRKEFGARGGRVVAVTGSAGKTTVKEVLAHVLATSGKKVARNKLNFNNQVGMPLSVLAASGDEDVWVMEVGISEAHDMDILGAILQPDVALIVNVGAAHTQGLGDKGVAYYKSRLLAHVALPEQGGKAFASADYADLREAAQAVYGSVQYFSAENAPQAAYSAVYLARSQGKGKYAVRKSFDGSGAGQRFEVLAPFIGAYGAENVAAIVAVAEALGLDSLHIQQGLQQASLPQQRFDMQKIGAWHIIDDSYNANPLSMKRMLLAAVDMAKAEGLPCYAVLGAMGELGAEAETEHVALGQVLAQSGIQHIFWAGDFGAKVQEGLSQEGYAGSFVQVKNVANFTHHWGKLQLQAGMVLCKGSRSNKLEELVTIIHIHAQQNAQSTSGRVCGSEHVL